MPQWTHCKYGVCGVEGAPGEKCEVRIEIGREYKDEVICPVQFELLSAYSTYPAPYLRQRLDILGLLRKFDAHSYLFLALSEHKRAQVVSNSSPSPDENGRFPWHDGQSPVYRSNRTGRRSIFHFVRLQSVWSWPAAVRGELETPVPPDQHC